MIQQQVIFLDPGSPCRQDFMRKLDFVRINSPLASRWIGFCKEDDLEVNFEMSRERIEYRNAVWRDYLGDDDQSMLHCADLR